VGYVGEIQLPALGGPAYVVGALKAILARERKHGVEREVVSEPSLGSLAVPPELSVADM
jgi:hypothetical protein